MKLAFGIILIFIGVYLIFESIAEHHNSRDNYSPVGSGITRNFYLKSDGTVLYLVNPEDKPQTRLHVNGSDGVIASEIFIK